MQELNQNNVDVKLESDYRVIPIGESLDIYEFFSIIEFVQNEKNL